MTSKVKDIALAIEQVIQVVQNALDELRTVYIENRLGLLHSAMKNNKQPTLTSGEKAQEEQFLADIDAASESSAILLLKLAYAGSSDENVNTAMAPIETLSARAQAQLNAIQARLKV